MNLFVVPLESYDVRYTEQWNRWFPDALRAAGITYKYLSVEDSYSNSTLEGAVLNPIYTNRCRSWQIDRLLNAFEQEEIKDGDVIFFHTLWFPGLEALAYVRDVLRIDFRIVGVLHAGSYDPWDFRAQLDMDRWSAPLETSWLTITDRIIVASEFHKSMVIPTRNVDPTKLYVTGLPFKSAELREGRESLIMNKRDLIAYPHRNVPEKNPDIVNQLRSRFGNGSVIVTRDLCSSKAEYLDLLATCKICISDSHQETWGYSMLEATALGCIPIVPDRLCYRDMYPERYRFSSKEELLSHVNKGLNGDFGPLNDLENLITWADSSMSRIISVVTSW